MSPELAHYVIENISYMKQHFFACHVKRLVFKVAVASGAMCVAHLA